jgi:transforming growth factor-beta-induced protein
MLLTVVLMVASAYAFATGHQEMMEEQSEMGTAAEMEPTIVEVAQDDGRFETLVAALQAADLAGTLQGEGPFTVFAPTDEAFAKLPEGTVEALLEDVPTLTEILLYHVVDGQVPSSQVVELSSAETLQGQPVVVSAGEGVMVNDANVVVADVEASNGVIHVIDSVIMPPSADIVGTAQAAGAFETLVTAVQEAGLVDTLQSEGPFTVFAPTDDAFAALPEGTLQMLLENPEELAQILTYHVVPGRVFSGDVVGIDEAPSVQGQPIQVSMSGNSVMLNESANIVQTDILTTNGVIHVIDSVILPPEG